MITFIPLVTTNRVLRIINNCIEEMIENEFSYYDLIKDDEEEKFDYLLSFFPKHLCRENLKKCSDAFEDLLEWAQDNYLHELTSIHEYTLFHIFHSYFNEKEDFESYRKKEKEILSNFILKI